MIENDPTVLGKNWISQTLIKIAKDHNAAIESYTWQSSLNRPENYHCLIVSGKGKCTMKQFHDKDLVACLASDMGRTEMEVKLLGIVRFFARS
jgi:hypothetical protein